MTDDGVHCALEFNCVRWMSRDLHPKLELGSMSEVRTVCWLSARIYDDIEAPV
ncbi:MAG: hypothetical protein WBG41_03925 [Acidimicrobiales bacterium]